MLSKYYKDQNTALVLPRLRCSDYGFECDFIAEADDVAKVIVEYSKHSTEEHGIEYSKEAIMQFILRKGEV